MGKPSSTQLAKKSSNQSLSQTNTSKMNVPISSQKNRRAKKKHLQKTNNTIKKIFTQLRNDSRSESSIINIEDSHNSALNITTNDDVCVTGMIPPPDINNEYRNRASNAPIIIADNEPSMLTPNKSKYPMHHSTPIRKPSLDELILSASHRLINDTNNNKTKEINSSSFLTIDLTTESGFNRSTQPTIIDLDNTNDQQDLILTSVSNASSMSGDSEVTVLRKPETDRSITRQIKNNIANLNKRDKDKILAFLSENIFNGCEPTKIVPRAQETAEDTYIKDVIVGRKASRNSIGSNIYNPQKHVNTTGLRMIVIDGSNVAMAHSNHRYFSVPGLKIVIDYFLNRGHVVKAFVPRFRNKAGKCSHPQMLHGLERAGHVVFTPSREVAGQQITSYDDRYIIQCAAEFEGIIVSNDQFRDLFDENPRWRPVIQKQVLPYNWVNDMIMFPRDPLGRNGPTLERFLQMPPNH